MTTKQVDFNEHELLTSHDYTEPLVAGGVRCHGGFDDTGTYVSPRTKNRVPAIEAWDEQRAEQFGTDKLDIGLETWPEHFPNVDQTAFLIRNGVREPAISELTRIGTVEGFGSMLRYSPIPDLQACFADEIAGTAIAHLDKGLFEAHARDEAGFETEAGHDHMWFAARDIAFEHPVTEDQTQVMLARMGIPLGNPKEMAKLREAAMANRRLPDDVSFELESLVGRMVRLLFIEISAFHAFAWAEAVLSDTELAAGDGAAARLISFIRADEAPHVAYLGTVLSEMRDRTWTGEGGRSYDGTDMIGRIWDTALLDSIGIGRQQMLDLVMGEIEHAVADRTDRDDLLDEFFSLGNVQRRDDGTWLDHTDRRDGVRRTEGEPA